MKCKGRIACAAIGAGLALGAASLALAQDAWPSRVMRMVVGTTPGQASDILARVYADELAKSLGQAMIVGARVAVPAHCGSVRPKEVPVGRAPRSLRRLK